MTEKEYIAKAKQKAIELIDSGQAAYHFSNYLCHTAIITRALVKKDIDINDDELNTMIMKEINTMIAKFMDDERDLQLASLLFALSNETFLLEYSLLKSALNDAIDVYKKYGSDNQKRKEHVVTAAKKDYLVLFRAVLELMQTEEGDDLLIRVNKRYSLKEKELKKLRKELNKDFDSFVVIGIDDDMKELACGQ